MKLTKIIFMSICALVLITILMTISGCTSSGQTAATISAQTTAAVTTAIGTNPASKNEILIESNVFKPDSVTIKVGDTITWINKDSYSHTVKAKNGEFESGDLANGAIFNFTFTKEGTYDYICGLHTFMTGAIIVTK